MEKKLGIIALIVVIFAIGTGFFIHQEQNSALENSDLKVTSWELLLGPLPSPGELASYGLLDGKVAVVNDGGHPFYVTKLLVSTDNQFADGVPGSPVEPEEILVEPGENKSVKMYFEDSRSGLSYKIDMAFSYYLDNFTYREIQQDERWVELKLIAKTPENENLVATKTGTIHPAKSGFQSVGSKSESPENENG
ncbi:hypothetical protein AKJ65_00150 [candidate division MSBL1 archaeon SCGC-AAA259E19]|uniref:Uncharacterized protein n=1 Tax=candidate division MSBL1 archaeon SCGC-AAA259E19 TaxID=1698264 RepID=A0A133UP26_9EURY|nr:hypothetical protein AKJ65_00150 [candidate division MSBL1 archaeon SCGC-AAA259E19]